MTERAMRAAAKYLFETGLHHGWWKPNVPFADFELHDPIGFEEFMAIVERTVKIARGEQVTEDKS